VVDGGSTTRARHRQRLVGQNDIAAGRDELEPDDPALPHAGIAAADPAIHRAPRRAHDLCTDYVASIVPRSALANRASVASAAP